MPDVGEKSTRRAKVEVDGIHIEIVLALHLHHHSRSSSATMSTSTPPPRDSHIIYRLPHLHPDPLPLPIIVLSLDAVEQTSPLISDDALFTATLARLDKILGSLSTEYTLVVLSATSTLRKGQKSRLPGSLWWVWNWRRVPRRYAPSTFAAQPI